MSRDDQKRWDQRHALPSRRGDEEPRLWLKSIAHLLPRTGRALDLATGKGQDAVYLASLGLEVEAVDISAVGLGLARKLAEKRGLKITTRIADLETEPHLIQPAGYDLIICFRYLQRNLAPRIGKGLRPGGLAVLELVTRNTLQKSPDRNPDYLVESGELQNWFPGLTTLCFEEDWEGQLHLSRIVTRKP